MRANIEAFFFEKDLGALGVEHSSSYRTASPYPHIVLDDFLPDDVIAAILDEFPSPKAETWSRRSDPTEVKLQSTAEQGMGPATRQLLNQFNAAPFIDFLENLTGISGLIPDPHYLGGGLHQIERGGYLDVHADFNRHDRLGLDRRLNLLLYLNPDWREEYRGHFEMWSADMASCEKMVLPIINRCVIFSTTSTTYHGHPEPLRCPPDRTRRSLALYYYSSGRPQHEQRSRHTTLFQRRPAERRPIEWPGLPTRASVKRYLPPVVSDWLGSHRHR